MGTPKQASRQIRDRICSELYAELQGLGFSEPKAGKLHYLRSTDKHWKVYLEVHVAQRRGEYNVMPMFVVNWSRIRELKKRMEPESKHDHFLVCETFLNLMTARILRDDNEAWKNREIWTELYVPETGEIEPVVVRILDVFSRFGISWLRDWSDKETARKFVLNYGPCTVWHWLIAFTLIMETKGTEEACRWLISLEDPPSDLAQRQIEFLSIEFCDGVCGVS